MPANLTLAQKSVKYLQKNYRYFVEDPHFFWMKTMARFEFARDWAGRNGLTAQERLASARPTALSEDLDVGEVLSTLRREGYYVGMQIRPSILAGLLEHVRTTPCYADRDRALPFLIEDRAAMEEKLGRRLKVASYFGQQEDWPAFRALKSDPAISAIAEAYLGCEPVFVRTEIFWSFPGAATRSAKLANAQVFHCDINDFRTLKFFFYLSDVGPGDGPHSYIKKNARKRTLVHQLMGQRCASLPEELLIDTYGADQVVTVCGKAGLGFVGDPYYFHRGSQPVENSRLLMQVEVGCRRYRTWYFDFHA